MALLIAPLFTAGIALGGIQNAYAGVENPEISVLKAPHSIIFIVGETIPVSALVTNTGDVVLTNVLVVDDKAGVLSCVFVTLDLNDQIECTGSFTAVSSGTNIVTATGDSPIGDPVEATDSQPFVVEDPPSGLIGGTVGSMSTTSLLVAGAQANMGLWSLALVGMVGAGAAITYKLKSKKTEQ